jgi:DnaJ-class molecular chaperone
MGLVARVADNPYEVLGVPADAAENDIRSAYRKLAMRYHPDRNPDDASAEEKFKQVSEAYATLRDPEARARFDRYGSAAERPDFNTVDWQTVFREADVQVNWDAHRGVPRTGNPMFDVLFGAVAGMMRNSGLLPGEHRELDAAIPLTMARSGGSTHIHIRGPSICPECSGTGVSNGVRCQRCNGSGVLRSGSVVELQVPAGVRQGSKLRLKGVGGPGNPPGDVFVTLQIQLPAGVTLRGRDIFTEAAVTPADARTGIRTDVLGVPVNIPAGTADGAQLRHKGGGLGGGDLIVTVRHDLLRGLWRKFKNLLATDGGKTNG